MKTTVMAMFAAVALLAVSGCTAPTTGGSTPSASASSEPNSSKPTYAKILQMEIPELLKANAIPGAVMLINAPKQGDWSGAFGTAEIGKQVPISVSDYIRIGSNTKPMTATVILQLFQEGKLKLDDPISKFRPDVPNGENITIAQLANMRSGLFSYTFDAGFNATMDNDPHKVWTPEELLAVAFSHPAEAPPGQKYDYNNTNFVLLGLVIEKVTGMSAAEAFQKRIFEPLGLTHTSLPANTDSTIPTPHAQGYQFGTNVQTIDSYAVPSAQLPAALAGSLKPRNQTDTNPSWAWTAGSAISTPGDLATFVKALATGDGLLTAETQKIRLDSIQPSDPSQPNGVGYGFGVAQLVPGVLGHAGQIPGYATFMGYDTNNGDTIVGTNLSASANSGENASVVVAKSVFAALHGSVDPSGGSQVSPSATASSTAG